jgi:hypothetical protein
MMSLTNSCKNSSDMVENWKGDDIKNKEHQKHKVRHEQGSFFF